MGLPTPKDVHVDALLTNISIAAKNTKYIVDQIFPIVPVMKQSDIVPKFPRSHWFRNTAKMRAPGALSARGGFAVDASDTYFCKEYAFGFEIPDELRANADAGWDLDRQATAFVTDKIAMARELQFASNKFTTSVWGSDKTGGSDFTAWSTYATSSPLIDIETYKDTVEANGMGIEPNVFVMGKQVWIVLKWHPDVIDTLYKGSISGLVTEQMFAQLTGFEKVLIGRALYTTSPEVATTAYGTTGAGTDNETLVSYTRVWGKNALMLYVPASPSLLEAAAGYTFAWRAAGMPGVNVIRRFRYDDRRVDVIEGASSFDQKVCLTAAGLFLSGAVA